MEQDERRDMDPATGYVRLFNAFLVSGHMNTTYKAVFLKSLLDLGRHGERGHNGGLPGGEWIWVDGDTVTLDLHFVAARFIKYYWDRDPGLPLRQAINRGVPTIVQFVRRRSRAGGIDRPPALDELVSGSYEKLRRDTIKQVIQKQALTYLDSDMKSLYAWDRGSDTITLNADTIPFFRRHRATIHGGLDSKIAAHLEELNKGATKPAVWPAGAAPAPHALHPEAWRFMGGEQRQRCFYCDAPHGESPNIDRVLPGVYAFSAGMHNCVAACAACSVKKSGRLPAAEHFMGVLDRNDGLERRLARLPAGVRESFAGYDGVWYRKSYTAHMGGRRGDALLFRP